MSDLLEDEDFLQHKKRGRKRLQKEAYDDESQDKIKEWEKLLNSASLSKSEKKTLQNRISAQKSRNKRKNEQLTLEKSLDKLKTKFDQLAEVLD